MADTLKAPINVSPCTIGTLTLDLLLQEEEKLTSKVTQFPVESGGSASDHVIDEPDVLTITGFVTNSPIQAHPGTVDGRARATRTSDGHLTGPDINFAELALAYLREIRLAHQPITVTTRRGTWENMLVEEVTRTKTKDTGDALVFVIRLIKFTQVKLLYVTAPKRTKSKRAQPRAKGGKKDTTKPPDDIGSISYKGYHGILDTFFIKRPEP